MKHKNKTDKKLTLSSVSDIKVRFSEVDSMTIVWHGNYAKYFEDGREAFGKKYGLGYMDVYRQGYMIPLVKLDIDYKNQLKYDEEAELITTFTDNEAAKIEFHYELYRKSDKKLIAKGRTVQVFLNEKSELELLNPPFFLEWKEKYLYNNQ